MIDLVQTLLRSLEKSLLCTLKPYTTTFQAIAELKTTLKVALDLLAAELVTPPPPQTPISFALFNGKRGV